jgi:L-threonylcarbamoyladenylate synthase
MNVMTYTKTHNSMMASQDIKGAAKALKSGGLVLFPTDTIWTIGCDLLDPAVCTSLLRLKKNPSPYGFEVLVNSLKMFKELAPVLHPKLETLLFYHHRPMSVLIEPPHNFPRHVFDEYQTFSVRLVHDEFACQIINEFGRPLFSTFATPDDEQIPATFGHISSSILQQMDFVAKFRQSEKNKGQPAVVVTISDNDEMVFLTD